MSQESKTSRLRGRPLKADADGREVLLKAAIGAFGRHGFDAADLRGIATSAGVSPNLVRVHFSNKDGLWSACVARLADVMTPSLTHAAHLIDDDRPIYERLCEAISIMAAFYDAFPDARDFVVRAASDSRERAGLVAEMILLPAYEAGRPLIAAGIDAGVIRAPHPALVFALLNSTLAQPPQFPDLIARLAPELTLDEARALLVQTMISTLLHEPADLSTAGTADARQKGQP